jgi:outer membrane protein assembly factor BamB
MVPRWSVEISAPPVGAPAIVGETIVVPLQTGRVSARRLADGKEIWQAAVAIDRPIAADADRVYVPSADAMQALELATGALQWRTNTGSLTAPPLVHSGWIVTAAAGSLSALRGSDGTVVWQQNLGTVEFKPAIDGDFLFVPLVEGPVVCLNLQTGEKIWQRQLGGSPGEPMAIAGKVYVSGADKVFYVLDAANGEELWHRRVGAAPRGRAAVDLDNIYFVALDNVLWALDRGHGAIKWRQAFKYRPAEGPSLIRGAIIVPGAVPTLAVFAPDRRSLTDLTFPSTVVAFSTSLSAETGTTLLSAVTGDLEHPWTLWLLEPSTDPPPIPLVPLTALPGVTVEFVLPQ